MKTLKLTNKPTDIMLSTQKIHKTHAHQTANQGCLPQRIQSNNKSLKRDCWMEEKYKGNFAIVRCLPPMCWKSQCFTIEGCGAKHYVKHRIQSFQRFDPFLGVVETIYKNKIHLNMAEVGGRGKATLLPSTGFILC